MIDPTLLCASCLALLLSSVTANDADVLRTHLYLADSLVRHLATPSSPSG